LYRLYSCDVCSTPSVHVGKENPRFYANPEISNSREQGFETCHTIWQQRWLPKGSSPPPRRTPNCLVEQKRSSNTFFDVSECWVTRDIVPSLFLVVRSHVRSQIHRCMFPNSFILLLMFFSS
jgi:hypothetical protein